MGGRGWTAPRETARVQAGQWLPSHKDLGPPTSSSLCSHPSTLTAHAHLSELNGPQTRILFSLGLCHTVLCAWGPLASYPFPCPTGLVLLSLRQQSGRHLLQAGLGTPPVHVPPTPHQSPRIPHKPSSHHSTASHSRLSGLEHGDHVCPAHTHVPSAKLCLDHVSVQWLITEWPSVELKSGLCHRSAHAQNPGLPCSEVGPWAASLSSHL